MYCRKTGFGQENTLPPRGNGNRVFSVISQNKGGSNLTQVTVIHGKGTGAVRKAVHTYLKRCKGVASFRLGRFGEGEDGVTIVDLK